MNPEREEALIEAIRVLREALTAMLSDYSANHDEQARAALKATEVFA